MLCNIAIIFFLVMVSPLIAMNSSKSELFDASAYATVCSSKSAMNEEQQVPFVPDQVVQYLMEKLRATEMTCTVTFLREIRSEVIPTLTQEQRLQLKERLYLFKDYVARRCNSVGKSLRCTIAEVFNEIDKVLVALN